MVANTGSLAPIPVPDEVTRPFWDAAREGRLVIQRCLDCRRYYHPPQVICPRCVSSTLEFQPVSGRGTVHSYSIMRDRRVMGFEDRVPYVTVLVELEEQPLLTMVTNLLDAAPEDVRIGLPVEVTFQKLTEEITLPQFRLVR
ncbi:MAG: Zn-ribbon domain-containing OB-fold protein [Dehalococcoidia bacterium]